MIDQAFPPELRKRTNAGETLLELKNGSIWQLAGSDNYDSLVGGNYVGLVFSEWSLCDPLAWEYLRPILRENGGWAWFIFTPRGHNHAWRMFRMAQESERWHCRLRPYTTTGGVVTEEDVQAEIDEGMQEEMAEQEFACSFEGGMVGSIYHKDLQRAEKEGRIGNYPYNPNLPVTTVWDLGFRDNTSILFAQRHESGACIIVDHETNRNKPMDHYIRLCQGKDYSYEAHWGPHDLENHDFTIGMKRIDYARAHGFYFEPPIAKVDLADGIDAAHRFLRRCYINKDGCQQFLDSMYSYRRQYDEKRQMFSDKPYHDWTSHDCDAFRYLSMVWDDQPLHQWSQRWVRGGLPQVKRSVAGTRAH